VIKINIFYLDKNPYECAKLHTNKHVVKMILEYAQLLSTAHRFLDGTPIIDKGTKTGRQRTTYILYDNRDSLLYRATHINHPSAIWVRKSKENYVWLAHMLLALCMEYTYRYEKTHKVQRDKLCFVLLGNIPKNIGNQGWSEPTPAMPDTYKVNSNSILSYINYYVGAKQHLASWKKREKPDWYIYA
jgi:hypothetical protein